MSHPWRPCTGCLSVMTCAHTCVVLQTKRSSHALCTACPLPKFWPLCTSAAKSLDVLSDLPLQEVEPGCYSIAFGDARILEGRIQVIRRHDPRQLSLQRIAEYKHDKHLLDYTKSSGAEHQPGNLERACQQVLYIGMCQCDVLAASGTLQYVAPAGKPAPQHGMPAVTRHA